MVNQEIAIAISAAFFGIMSGFSPVTPVTRADDYQQWTKDFLSGA
jgi:hypothetical protein